MMKLVKILKYCLLCLLLGGCADAAIRSNSIKLKQGATQIANYIKSSGDADLANHFYPMPDTFTGHYQLAVFPNSIRFSHEIPHTALKSAVSNYQSNYNSSTDEIANRYRAFILRRGNALKRYSAEINKRVIRYAKVWKIKEHFLRGDLDELLVEVTPDGQIISLLTRANQFSAHLSFKQMANTFQDQQSFLIYGERARKIMRKLKFDIKPM
jgi:hypothetical protein